MSLAEEFTDTPGIDVAPGTVSTFKNRLLWRFAKQGLRRPKLTVALGVATSVALSVVFCYSIFFLLLPPSFVETATPGEMFMTWALPAIVPLMVSFPMILATLAVARSMLRLRDTISSLKQQVEQAKQIGQYVLVRKIGEGGMGAVYYAQHALLRRPTAVKLL